jgi:Leucine-rich repeat (LRR) protein
MINVNMMKNYQTWIPLIIDRKIEIGRLTHLSLISCGITEVPEKIFDEYLEIPNKLEVLNLSKNNIKSIPKRISRCNALKYLILNENENLNNDGFPWDFLPFSIQYLYLNKTATCGN